MKCTRDTGGIQEKQKQWLVTIQKLPWCSFHEIIRSSQNNHTLIPSFGATERENLIPTWTDRDRSPGMA